MELTQEYFDEQLSSLATSIAHNMATKADLYELHEASKIDMQEIRDSLVGVMASKADVTEIKSMLERIDRRTDEDVRATVKDVMQLKKDVAMIKQSLRLSN